MQERCCCAHNATRTAPATLGPLHATARTQRLFLMQDLTRRSHLPPPVVASKHARSAFFLFRVHIPFSAGRFPFLLAAHCAAPACKHARTRSALRHACTRARTHTRARTTGDERRDVRSAGVADWKTARRGHTEHTLTCVRVALYLHATAMGDNRQEGVGLMVSCDLKEHCSLRTAEPNAPPLTVVVFRSMEYKKSPAGLRGRTTGKMQGMFRLM